MDSIKVTLHLADLNSVMEADIPMDMTTQDVVNEILDQVLLPSKDHLGEAITYIVRSEMLGRFLIEGETLSSAGVISGDTLFVIRQERPSGGTKKPQSRIKFDKSSIGLSLDDLAAVDIRTLLANEPALMMTLHSYRTSLIELGDSREALSKSEEDIRHLNDRLKEKNIATVLLLLGQIQVGFGTNLVTSKSTGGWFVFLAGVAMNIGALFFSVFGLKRSERQLGSKPQ